MVWLTGSGIFNPVLRVQIQVQVLPVATVTTLVCRYEVKYHGEWFDIAPCSHFCYLKYVPSEHKQYQSTHHDISPHIYIPALLPLLLVVLALVFVHVAQG